MSKEIVFFNIEYDVNSEDLERENSNKKKYKSVEDLHNSLPEEVIVEVDDDYFDDEDWEDYGVSNELSDSTGWCVCDFDYRVKHIEDEYFRFASNTLNALDKFMTEEGEDKEMKKTVEWFKQ